jgi:hypothetical protein
MLNIENCRKATAQTLQNVIKFREELLFTPRRHCPYSGDSIKMKISFAVPALHEHRMKFRHLIEINDPLNPLIDPLTREQLWRGLVLRAEAPTLFMPHLDRCDITARTESSLSRKLRYGDVVVHDHVTFSPQEAVVYEVPAQGDIPASSLSMRIEEPEPDIFYVRFEYDDPTPDTAGSIDAYYNEFRRSAYYEADIDTIRIIRQLAEEGRFDFPLS